jgi:anti-anti-sigma factor
MRANHQVVRFDGTLDASRYPEFRQVFEALPHSTPVLVDLTGVDAVDSVFLSEMLLARRRHTAPFAILIAPRGSMARVFEIAGLDRRAYVFHEPSEAVAWLALADETQGVAPD